MSAPAPWTHAWMLGPKSSPGHERLYRFRPEPIDRFRDDHVDPFLEIERVRLDPRLGSMLRVEIRTTAGWRRIYHLQTRLCVLEAARRAGLFRATRQLMVKPSADSERRIESFRLVDAPQGGAA